MHLGGFPTSSKTLGAQAGAPVGIAWRVSVRHVLFSQQEPQRAMNWNGEIYDLFHFLAVRTVMFQLTNLFVKECMKQWSMMTISCSIMRRFQHGSCIDSKKTFVGMCRVLPSNNQRDEPDVAFANSYGQPALELKVFCRYPKSIT